jgi:hypothetical protein
MGEKGRRLSATWHLKPKIEASGFAAFVSFTDPTNHNNLYGCDTGYMFPKNIKPERHL